MGFSFDEEGGKPPSFSFGSFITTTLVVFTFLFVFAREIYGKRTARWSRSALLLWGNGGNRSMPLALLSILIYALISHRPRNVRIIQENLMVISPSFYMSLHDVQRFLQG